MKRNLQKQLIFFDGKPVEEIIGKNADGSQKKEPLLASTFLARTLFASTNSTLSPEDRYRAYKICQRITSNPESVELDSEDIVLIRKVIADPGLSVGIYGQIIDLLEDK